jgi:hypothetical protein
VNYFDCRRRLHELHAFRRLGATYYNHVRFSRDAWMRSGPTEDDEAKRARLLLNQMMVSVCESFDFLGGVGLVAAILGIHDHPNFVAHVSKIIHSMLEWR